MGKKKGFEYRFVEERLTWRAALGNCLLKGGNLAVANNNANYEVLKQMLIEHRTCIMMGWKSVLLFNSTHKKSSLQKQNIFHVLKHVRIVTGKSTAWVDGTDLLREGTWYCATTGRNCPRLNWASGQPDNGSGTEHCVQIIARRDGLNDDQCYNKFPSICELPQC